MRTPGEEEGGRMVGGKEEGGKEEGGKKNERGQEREAGMKEVNK